MALVLFLLQKKNSTIFSRDLTRYPRTLISWIMVAADAPNVEQRLAGSDGEIVAASASSPRR